ncbi:MAG: tail fiber domain-containing protein [Flavobacteriales bacterium]|nr:tail fiber domain-containing protein [Flavobacteriales bacterium]
MKNYILLLLLVLNVSLFAQNQVGINQSIVDPSAVLELNSTNRGLLIPRLTSTQKGKIDSPAQGLVIFETSTNSYWYYNGAGWIKITSNEAGQDGIGDTDSDTRIYIDYTNDVDQIRFYTSGILSFRMNRKRFDVLNNGNSVFFGDSAGYVDDRVKNSNVYVGTSSGVKGVGAKRNVAVGYQTLRENVSQTDNVAIGVFSSLSGLSARRNVAIGGNSLLTNIASDFHTVIGHKAYEHHFSNGGVVAIGIHALNFNTVGSYNIAIGAKAMENNISSGANVMVGHEVGKNYLGTSSVSFGFRAGYENSDSRGVFIDNSSTINPLIHGNLSTNALTINDHLRVSSNIVYVGNLTDVSDKRLKRKIKPVKNTLTRLTQLNGYRYHLKSNESDSKEYGLIAQEVAEVFPTLARRINPGTDHLGVSYVQFIPLILNAETEQFQQLQELNKELTYHEGEISSVEQEIALIKAKMSALSIQP